jgi:hypothetical protein
MIYTSKIKFGTLCLFSFLSGVVHAQALNKLELTAGVSFSNQIKAPRQFADDGYVAGFAAAIEPTICSFGGKKQFDFNTNFSFVQRGGQNFSPINVPFAGTGSETYPVIINYLSFSPLLKANFWKILFLKAGPRVDVFTGFNKRELSPGNDPRTSKDFNQTTWGVNYGIGMCTGKKNLKFISELIGQNDFTQSSYNKASGQTFKNYSYLINFGILMLLRQ